MRYIDMETWKRRKQYEMFRTMELPHFNICSNVDVRELKEFCRREKLSFFKCILYLISRVVNGIPELRTRIRKDGIVQYDRVNPSFTILGDDELFGFAKAEHTEDFDTFYKGIEDGIERVKNNISPDFDADMDSDFYLTTLPWVSFTSIQHPMHIVKKDCIPRIALGKYFESGDRLLMPVALQAHHGLADGVHAGKFYMKLEEYLKTPEKYLER